MTSQTQITIFLILWLVTAGVILFKSWSKREVNSGLTIIYIARFSLIYFFGALIYTFPWYRYGDIEATLNGFREATYGILAFGFGNLILAPYFMRLFYLPQLNRLNNVNKADAKLLPSLPKMYFLIGIIFYFILFSTIGHLPTINALISVGQQLMVVGVCLACWQAWCEKNKRKLIIWLLLSLSFPFITIINQGFIGYGAMMTLIVFLFTAIFYRPKWKVLIAGALLVYLGLTFYQSYMRDRGELRAVVWGGASITDRVRELTVTLRNPEWFNPFNVEHLERIDARLNQNFLVGVATDYLKRNDYAYGGTVWQSIIALIPRILWPDKPVYAGSPGIVSKYTGLTFAKGTSVGVGQVMEFYINFGTIGVVIGFLVLGIVIALIDFMAGHNLRKGNWQKFVLWFLPGLAFLQVGGSLVEVTSSAGAGIVVAILVNKYVKIITLTK